MKKPLISVIVPAKNAEKTIENTILSIEKELDEYEIIVAENGSADGTSSVVERLQKKNCRIKLIHTERGVSIARNEAIQIATGMWIAFVDADDEWAFDYNTLDKTINEYADCDMLFFGYYKNGNRVNFKYGKEKQIIDTKEGIIDVLCWSMNKPTTRMPVWAKLYKRTFFADNKLQFNEKLTMSEDSEFLIRCLNCCGSLAIIDFPIYNYIMGVDSSVRTVEEKKIEEYLCALKEAEKSYEGKTDKAFRNYVIAHLNLIAVHLIYNNKINEKWNIRNRRLENISSNHIIGNTLKKVTLKDISDAHMIPAFFFKHRMFSMGGAICYLKAVMNNKKYRKVERREQ